MEVLLNEARRNGLSIADESLVGVLRGLGPSIFHEFAVARFLDWLDKFVSDHVLLNLMGGCTDVHIL